MAATEAQKKAVAKYEAEKVDRINCRLPKPLKQEIEARSTSVNAFIIEAVREKLARDASGASAPGGSYDGSRDHT